MRGGKARDDRDRPDATSCTLPVDHQELRTAPPATSEANRHNNALGAGSSAPRWPSSRHTISLGALPWTGHEPIPQPPSPERSPPQRLPRVPRCVSDPGTRAACAAHVHSMQGTNELTASRSQESSVVRTWAVGAHQGHQSPILCKEQWKREEGAEGLTGADQAHQRWHTPGGGCNWQRTRSSWRLADDGWGRRQAQRG